VGIGASAGGLAAFEAFFSAMPGNTESGMAFVLVQHLSPDYKSILSDLIKRYTPMRVFEVVDGVTVQPNCAYIIPPNRDMAFLNGTLHLLEPGERRGMRLPIDFFFRSLAQDQRERAIGIVLSGTGSDGSLGVRAIKGEGGMVMAQTPESADFDGMPRNAIATNLVDYVLPPAEMAAQLINYVAHAFGNKSHLVPATATNAEESLKKICILLRAQTGHDFSQYKPTTLSRRVERRMALHQISRLDDYLRFLRETPGEGDALFQDLLIGVTSFFRDPEAFDLLETQVIPRLFAEKPEGSPVRIWVCGCSTGEEAYSLAILIQEHLERLGQHFRVQIFATDVNPRSVEHARAGIYPASIAADISAERLSRFFTPIKESSFLRIQKEIRELVIFSEQDLIRDPPFSKLDLLSCRNLLIYMQTDLQKKIIPLFHYALAPGGMLFLGNSETVGEHITLFAPVDRKWKIYERLETLPSAPLPIISQFYQLAADDLPYAGSAQAIGALQGKVDLQKLISKALLAHYAMAAALINAQGEILYIHGRTGKYLEPATGAASVNILAMARPGLHRELTMALHRVVNHGESVHCPGLQVQSNGDSTLADLTVKPVEVDLGAGAASQLFLVILEEKAADATPLKTPGDLSPEDAGPGVQRRITQLEQELQAKDEYLQTTLEEMETANEELKSANEELQSVNEEMQSTNEELETSKEELQSVNEELATVNAELQTRVADLSQINNDMNNLLAGTGIGTLFVDMDLRITRFTPAVTQVINLIPSDIGRPVAHIVSNLVGYDRLVQDVQTTLDSLIPQQIDVQSKSDHWFQMSIRPYRTPENVIQGAVLTFVNITDRKRLEGLARLAVVVRDANDAITMQDLNGTILAWNRSAQRIYGWSEAEAVGMSSLEMVPDSIQAETAALLTRLREGGTVAPFKTQRRTKDGRPLNIWLTITKLVNEAGVVTGLATTERTISDQEP
jgi:two-component system CheB/CheR fusion protein